MAQYGRTWWGKQWLEAFNGIDESNRLPRGRTYANTGRAYDIIINGTHISAKVQGSRHRPYKVKISLNGFTKTEAKKIRHIIINSPTILAQLVNKQLSQNLPSLLRRQYIDLFPSNWQYLNANCSCPDWAVPCKHIAAVIYLIAAEIDKNPFTVFTINGCNLLDLIGDFGDGNLENIQKVTSIDTLLAPYKCTEKKFDQSVLDNIDLAHIPNLSEQICAILTNNPLFYDKNFRDILQAAYKHWQRYRFEAVFESESTSSKNANEEEIFSAMWGHIENWQTIHLVLDEVHQLVEVNNGTNSCFKNKKNFSKTLGNFLSTIPSSILHKLNPELHLLHILNQYTHKLIDHGAFIPQILQNKQGYSFIRWVPALFDSSVQAIYKKLTSICPQSLVKFNKNNLSPEEQIKSVISVLLSGYITNNIPKSLDRHINNDIGKLFFSGQAYKFDDFSTKELPETINLWLSRLYISEKVHKLYLLITNTSNRFTIDMRVSLDNAKSPIKIQKALKTKNSQTKLSILSDLALLAEYIPRLEQIIDTGKKLLYSFADFGPLFLHILPILRALGITIILPKSLKKILKPKLNLDLSSKEKITYDSKSFMQLDDLLTFDWQIAIGDKKISITKFKKLLQNSRGLIKIMDQFVLLDEKEMESFLKKIDKLPKRLQQAELMQAALAGSLLDVDAEVHLDKHLDKLFSKFDNYQPVTVPLNINAVLRPYQERGFSWLVQNIETGFGSILADDMGLGKTLQVIAAILHCKNTGSLTQDKVLIVVPTSLLTNWQKEIERFAPELNICIYHGQDRKFAKNYDIIITSYGLARRDKKVFNKIGWFLLIIDEAQNIKKSAKGVYMVMSRLGIHSKMVFNGDLGQSDIGDDESALLEAVRILKTPPLVKGVGVVELYDRADIQRHPLLYEIMEKFGESDDCPF